MAMGNGASSGTGKRQSRPPVPASNSATGQSAAIEITVGGTRGSLISLDVALAGQGSGTGLHASLGVTVDPTAAACTLQQLGIDPAISRQLSGLQEPASVRVDSESSHPLVIRLSPTGVPSQPLNCTVLSPGAQSSLPAAAGTTAPTAAASSTNSVSGTVGRILSAVDPIPSPST